MKDRRNFRVGLCLLSQAQVLNWITCYTRVTCKVHFSRDSLNYVYLVYFMMEFVQTKTNFWTITWTWYLVAQLSEFFGFYHWCSFLYLLSVHYFFYPPYFGLLYLSNRHLLKKCAYLSLLPYSQRSYSNLFGWKNCIFTSLKHEIMKIKVLAVFHYICKGQSLKEGYVADFF